MRPLSVCNIAPLCSLPLIGRELGDEEERDDGDADGRQDCKPEARLDRVEKCRHVRHIRVLKDILLAFIKLIERAQTNRKGLRGESSFREERLEELYRR